ncbi:MAG: PKD domain-containing protein [Bacteroidetes bacterium]|nr:PKD domain-containing protein [Bacteroidota bacterium]
MKKIFLLLFFIVGWYFIGNTQHVLVIQPGPEDTMDIIVRSDIPDSNNPKCSDGGVAAWTFQGNFGIDRTFIRFDLSMVPSTATIHSAKLSLYYKDSYSLYPYGHYGDNGWLIQRITLPWNGKTLIWNNQPSATDDKEVAVPPSTDWHQDFPDLDVTQIVKEMIANPETNYGFMLRLQTEELWRAVLLASNDYEVPDHRPKLVVEYITCPAPVAGFTWTAQYLAANFTDASSSSTAWHWNFGDGGSSSIQNPEHTYAQSGNYQVCLLATDSCGTDSVCQTVNITCVPPQAQFFYDYQYPEVSFHDTSATGNLISRLWDFGDDSASTEKDPVHVYSYDTLVYIACLTVIDSCGSSTHCDTIFLYLPLVHFTQHYVGTTEKLIQFTGTIEGASNWHWDFDDGTTSDLKNPEHLYKTMGKFNVCLTAGNSIGTKTFCDIVEVLPLILHSGHNLAILYPNPSSGIVQLQVSDDVPSAGIKVTTISGATVFSHKYGAIENTQPIELDLRNTPEGMYNVQFTYGEYSRIFKLFIVQ